MPIDREHLAQICHAANRAYCAALGDFAQPEWNDAPKWQQDSARKGVDHALDHPLAKPEDSHNSWLAEKQREGWVYGPVKDPVLKQHPCFVPYDQLPVDQQKKDALFLAVVRALA